MGEKAIKQEARLKIERFGLESVPSDLRTTNGFEYTMIQVAVMVNAGNFLVPALAVLEGGLSFYSAIFSTILGATVAFLLVAFLTIPGAKYGIPAQYAMRTIMGSRGARFFASPVRTLTSLYWFAVQTIGGTYLLKELIERTLYIEVSFLFISLIMAIIMAILALVGFNAVKKVTKYFMPVLFIGGVVMLYIFATTDMDGVTYKDVLNRGGNNDWSTIVFFASLAFVQYISMVSSASDMTRYAKTTNHGFYGLMTGNILGFSITAILGAYTAALAGSWNPYVITSQLTNSAILIFIIFVAAMASMIMINLNNAYTGGYSLLNSIPRLGRVKSAILFGITAILLSTFPSLVEDAKSFISYLGAFTTPLSAVVLADFIFVKRKQLTTQDIEQLENNQYRYNVNGIIAIIVGMMLYFVIPEAFSPGFISFILTGFLYLFLHYKKSMNA